MSTLFDLELAASNWWNRLSHEEQQAYIKAHPKTRMRLNKNPKATKPEAAKPNNRKIAVTTSKPVCLDRAFMHKGEWSGWNKRLLKMENKFGLKRVKVDITDAPPNFNDGRTKTYAVWYENPGIKVQRAAKTEIRRMYEYFDNRLSRGMK
jgi:hypothetical protein